VVSNDSASIPFEITDDGSLNLSIFSEASWRNWLIKDHNIQAIACLYLPPENVLLNRKDWKKDFQLNEKKLKFAALRKASSSFNRARIYWLGMQDMFYPLSKPRIVLVEEDVEALKGLDKAAAIKKSKKMIAHAFRNIFFAQQLFDTGHITDLYAVVPIWKELLEDPIVDWSYYVEKYETRYHQLITQFPEVCKELPDQEKLNMPESMHRLHSLIQLPPIQSSYRQGIEREMLALIRTERSSKAVHNDPDVPSSDSLSFEELISNHFSDSIADMFRQTTAFYDSMVQLLESDFRSLMTLVSHLTSQKGTKPGQEIAALASEQPHYTLMFGMWKTDSSAESYLASCPWTRFDIMEKYMRTSPTLATWSSPPEASGSSI
jgi:hypothetical protein